MRPPISVSPDAQQRLGLALRAEADVLVPVELERGGEVVDLGQAEVRRADARLVVGRARDRVLERTVGRRHHGARVGGEVRQLEDGLRVARRHGGDRLDPGHAVGRAEGVARVVHARHDHRRRTVGRRADVEQTQRIGDDGAVDDIVDGVLLAEARVRVLEPVARVLHLDAGEVVGGRAVDVHAASCVEREVHRVGCPQQVEAQPVGVVPALAADRREESLRRGVGTDHQRHVAVPGQDLRTRLVEGLRARGARGVAGRDAHAGPAQLLGERRAGDEPGVPVADGVGPGDVLDVAPGEAGVVECGPRRDHPVLGEVTAPLAPGMHADPEDRDVAFGAHLSAPGAFGTGPLGHARCSAGYPPR